MKKLLTMMFMVMLVGIFAGSEWYLDKSINIRGYSGVTDKECDVKLNFYKKVQAGGSDVICKWKDVNGEYEIRINREYLRGIGETIKMIRNDDGKIQMDWEALELENIEMRYKKDGEVVSAGKGRILISMSYYKERKSVTFSIFGFRGSDMNRRRFGKPFILIFYNIRELELIFSGWR